MLSGVRLVSSVGIFRITCSSRLILLSRSICISPCSSSSAQTRRCLGLPDLRQQRVYSSTFEQKAKAIAESQEMRRRYFLSGFVMIFAISVTWVLLWRRRSEYRDMNAVLPPVTWEQFAEGHLLKDEIKAIVYQPSFHVADVYLRHSDEREKMKHFLATYRLAPGKYSRTPDIRFTYDGDTDSLKRSIEQLTDGSELNNSVDFEVNEFPSYSEIAFIIVCAVFALMASSGF